MPDAPTLRDIARALEAWAPPASQQSYDNSGLQVGDPARDIRKALVALDCTAQIIDEAKRLGAEAILAHHPLLFKPIKQLAPGTGPAGLAWRLATEGIALYSIHTNLDAAPGGVSFALAQTLGVEHPHLLEGMPDAVQKLTVYVPAEYLDPVRAAMAEAGAGRIGAYEACAFATPGTGFYRPTDAAQPFQGTAGELEQADEVRLEAEVARWDAQAVLHAAREAHPYEEMAYDLVDLQKPSSQAGLGAIGKLPEPMKLDAFLERVAERLDAASLRYAGDPEAPVHTVAVCGGAGSGYARLAQRAGADAYVTADVTYHQFFDVLDADGRPQMAFIDAGHYETEVLTERLLADWLAERFPQTTFVPTETRTSPMQTFSRAC